MRFPALLDLPLIRVMEGGALDLLLEEQARRIGRTLRYHLSVGSLDACHHLIAAGHGIAIMPEGVCRRYEALLHLRCVPLAEDWAVRELRLMSRPEGPLPSPSRLLRDHLLIG